MQKGVINYFYFALLQPPQKWHYMDNYTYDFSKIIANYFQDLLSYIQSTGTTKFLHECLPTDSNIQQTLNIESTRRGNDNRRQQYAKYQLQ